MMLGNPSEIMGNEGVVCMIREERLLGAFRELVSIDNPTLRERGVCDHLLRRYAALGIRLQEDGTGAVIGGNAGNLYAFVPGDEALAPVLLSRIRTPSRPPAASAPSSIRTAASPPTARPCSARTIWQASAPFSRP